MGEAKRRAQEIAELKQTPKERKRRKLMLMPVKLEPVNHFINAAARSKAKTGNANAPGMPPSLVQTVNVKVKQQTWVELPAKPPKQPWQITLVTGRKLNPEEFLIHASAMNQINPNGFRQISAKEKNWKSTSMLEQLSIKLGDQEKRTGPERSKRGLKKLEACKQTKAMIILERLIETNPEKAAQAKKNPSLVRWFFGKAMAALAGDIDPTWLETVTYKKIAEGGIHRKYLSAHARHRRDEAASVMLEAA